MKDAIETLLTRRSIKKYNGKPIPEDVLNKILEVGTYAPTAKNMQKPIIIVIQDKKVRAEIAEENAKIMGMEDFDPFYGDKRYNPTPHENTEESDFFPCGCKNRGFLR